MTPGLASALLAMLGFGASDLLYKRAGQAGIASHRLMVLQAWTFCPTITVYALLTGNLRVGAPAIWGALGGLFALIAFYNFAHSLRAGSVSAVAPIFRLNFTITAALAIIVLGEPLTAPKLAGLTLALAAVVLLLIEPRRDQTPKNVAALARVLLAMIALGVGNLFHKVGLLHGATPETLISAQAWVFCSLATLQSIVTEGRVHISAQTWGYAGAAALLQVVAFVSLLHGLVVGAASVLFPVAQLGFIVTAILGAAVFGEHLSRRKVAGLAVAAGALILLAFS